MCTCVCVSLSTGLLACVCSFLGCDVLASERGEEQCMRAAENLALNMAHIFNCNAQCCGAASVVSHAWGEDSLANMAHKLSDLKVGTHPPTPH